MDFIIPSSELKPQVHFCPLRGIKPREAIYWRHQYHNCSTKIRYLNSDYSRQDKVIQLCFELAT